LYARSGRAIRVQGDHDASALASPGTIGQVIDVLLDNALRHGAGRVLVRVAERDGRPTITVTDQGPGVASEQRALIFQRGHSGRDGSGLGLHLARSLVDSAGGKLELRELRPPEFEIRLQAAPTP
jgi:signal transduction histidine kinase